MNLQKRNILVEMLEPRWLLDNQGVGASGDLLISEFMAINSGTLLDEDGVSSDWIEIFNPTTDTIDLTGAYLTDNVNDLTKWRFPAREILSNDYLLVFASGKDRSPESGPLHSNFQLSGTGEDVLLVLADGQTIADRFLDYPIQRADVSYGRTANHAQARTLVQEDKQIKYLVPTAADDSLHWSTPDYDDSHWSEVILQGSGPVLITELSTGNKSFVEIQNTGQRAVNTEHWTVLINNASESINSVDATTWTLPSKLEPRETHYRTDDPADNYWGDSFSWSRGGPGWVMLIDATGYVQDFVVWGYTEEQISSLTIDHFPHTEITVSEHWQGPGIETGKAVPVQEFFLDFVAGADTHPNTTSFNSANDFVLLKDSVSGDLAAGALIYQRNLPTTTAGSVVAEGTDAFRAFNGRVDFKADSVANIELSGDDYHGFQFVNLSRGSRTFTMFDLTATAVVGKSNYENRWTLVQLLGTESATPAHSQGEGIVVISPTEVAIWTGANHEPDQGYVVRWTEIVSTEDDQFALSASQYIGPTPGVGSGLANGPNGYGLTAIRLKTTDLTNETPRIVRTGNVDTDSKSDFSFPNLSTPGATNPLLVLPFTIEESSPTAIGYTTYPQPISRLLTDNLVDELWGVNSSLWTRLYLDTADPSQYDSLSFRIQYDAGFIAYLNGIQVAEANAPVTPGFDSTATLERTNEETLSTDVFDLNSFQYLLQSGQNVLAIHAFNSADDDEDLFIYPKLILHGKAFFVEPTPGQENRNAFFSIVQDVRFNKNHGFYTAPLTVELDNESTLATIRYTTDGSEPTPFNSTVYTSPLEIDSTTVLRAIAYRDNHLPSSVSTATYFFVDDVISQSSDGQPPTGWPASVSTGQVLDYGMDPKITHSPFWGPQLHSSLSSIPALSIAMDVNDLIDRHIGIYTNATKRGKQWERPISLELIDPDGSRNFQIDAGLRIRGGFSRARHFPKHAFRVFFRGQYGEPELKVPLFDTEGTDTFTKIDLRTAQDHSWSLAGDSRYTFLRDVFSRDIQGAMGHPYTRSRFYHLYLNGIYWGIYQTEERPDNDFATSYLGGHPDQYDVVKPSQDMRRVVQAINGNLDAYRRLHGAVITGLERNADYFRIQGMNPDGRINPAYERLLDVDNLTDYMIITYFTADADGPASRFTTPLPNNFFGIYNRDNPDGFKFFEHDSEQSLDTGDDNLVEPFTEAGANFEFFNPHWLHEQLTQNREYLTRFGDRLQHHLFHGGVLDTENAIATIDARASEIELAVIAESARWGDSHSEEPFTKDDWRIAVQDVKDWIVDRAPIVIEQLRAEGVNWFSKLDAPRLFVDDTPHHGGPVPHGAKLTITGSGDQLFYTLDGSDPRMIGGNISPAALQFNEPFELSESIVLKTRAFDSTLEDGWSALVETSYQLETPIRVGDLVITEINYNPHGALTRFGELDVDNDEFEFVELENTSERTINLDGVQLVQRTIAGQEEGISFTFSAQLLAPNKRLVIARNLKAFVSRYGSTSTVAMGSSVDNAGDVYTGKLANGGERLTLLNAAGEVLQEFDYNDDFPWPRRADGSGSSLEIIDVTANYNEPGNWQNSTVYGGSPSEIGKKHPRQVVISEVLANSIEPYLDTVELLNTSNATQDVSRWMLSDSTGDPFQFQFPEDTSILAGGHLVFDERDFSESGYNNSNDLQLSRFGDQLTLISADTTGRPHQFIDTVQFAATLPNVSLGRLPLGDFSNGLVPQACPTFGRNNLGHRAGEVVISEIHYNPPDDTHAELEFIELYNATNISIDLDTWRVDGAVKYDLFPTLQILPDGTVLVVSFDPKADVAAAHFFRMAYGIGMDTVLFGPWSEGDPLNNDGATINLERDMLVKESGALDFGHVLIDQVDYHGESPWPSSANGQGNSLQRTSPILFGSRSTSWSASSPSPGAVDYAASEIVDFNGDQVIDANDIDLLFAAVGSASSVVNFDLDRNDTVSLADVEFLLNRVLGTRFGDFDLDGDVDQNDLSAILLNFTGAGRGIRGQSWSSGDFDGDGDVDTRDMVATMINFSPASGTQSFSSSDNDQEIGRSFPSVLFSPFAAKRQERKAKSR